MKTYITKLFVFLFVGILTFSCEENERPIFDVENGRAIAGFNGGRDNPRVIFNPAENTTSTLTVGVSTLSSTDRSLSFSVDLDNSTLDPSLYSIEFPTVIPAGQFTADIVITTLASLNIPSASDVVVISLDGVEGAEFTGNSITEISLGVNVRCPEIIIDDFVGTYDVAAHEFDDFFSPAIATRTVVAGPGANQITIVEGAVAQENPDPLILNVDSEGSVSFGGAETDIHFFTFGPGVYGQVTGSALSCAGLIDITIVSPGFIPNFLTLIKQ
nr:hypothetical protein [Allomuricauda sp.]